MNLAPSELSHLKATHERLENELATLSRRSYLTPSEAQRARDIKKQKLFTKDRIRLLSMQSRLAG